MLLSSGVNMRRCARILGIDRKTVVRKLLFNGAQAKVERIKLLEKWKTSEQKLKSIQFDEMETFEHSKCLPLSIPLAVEPETRKILSFRVGRMPANGPLAEISRRKYGKREDDRPEMAHSLFSELQGVLAPDGIISTDKNPKYPGWIKPHFPEATHRRHKGRRGCVVGQGELKKVGFDPLFSLNQVCAMIRANVSRLIRRTWNTTKRRDRLEAHLELYVRYHNQVLT